MAIVEDALAGALGQDPHVIDGINELLAQKEALGGKTTVAGGTIHGEGGFLDAIVAEEFGELMSEICDLGREASKSNLGLCHGC